MNQDDEHAALAHQQELENRRRGVLPEDWMDQLDKDPGYLEALLLAITMDLLERDDRDPSQ